MRAGKRPASAPHPWATDRNKSRIRRSEPQLNNHSTREELNTWTDVNSYEPQAVPARCGSRACEHRPVAQDVRQLETGVRLAEKPAWDPASRPKRWPTGSPPCRAGASNVTLYAAGELVPGRRRVRCGVSEGTAELYHARSRLLGLQIQGHPAVRFSQPFGLRADEQFGWMYHGGGQALYDEMYGRFGIKPFLCGNSGPQWGGWFQQ